MSNISKRRREGSRTKIKSMGDHGEFLQRITRTLYYGTLPSAPGLSLPLTELSCDMWSAMARGRSLRRLRAAGCARVCAGRVSPAALVLLYLERLPRAYRAATPPDQLFLVSLMVSNKYLQDEGEDDEVECGEWAAAGRLAAARLRDLERSFLNAIQWNVHVSQQQFDQGLAALESTIAVRQANLHGFYTYSDLTCTGGGDSLAALTRALVAAAVAYTASLLALLGGALVVAHALAPRSAAPVVSPTVAPAAPLTDTHYIPNDTLSVLPPTLDSEPLSCCDGWLRYKQAAVELDDTWSQRQGLADHTWWRLALVSHGSLQRWLYRLAEYEPPAWLPRAPPIRPSHTLTDR